MQKRTLVIRPLTPIHIGCDEALSPTIDFLWQNGKVFILDKVKFEDEIERRGLSPKFFSFISEGRSKRLADFLKEWNIPLPIKEEIEAPLEIRDTFLRFIHTENKPYIPGSSIKGAVRTAILFWIYERDPEAKKKLLRRYNNWRKAKEAFERETRLSLLFGPDSWHNAMRNLAITDSLSVKNVVKQIINVKRISLIKKEVVIPSALEVVLPGTASEHGIRIGLAKEILEQSHPEFSFLGEGNFGKLVKIVNYFSLKVAERERGRWQGIKKEVTEFYSKLCDKIKSASLGTNTIYLRFGSHKTFFDQTLALILQRQLSQREWTEFVRRITPRDKKPADLNNFPTTEWVTADYQVLGWIEGTILP